MASKSYEYYSTTRYFNDQPICRLPRCILTFSHFLSIFEMIGSSFRLLFYSSCLLRLAEGYLQDEMSIISTCLFDPTHHVPIGLKLQASLGRIKPEAENQWYAGFDRRSLKDDDPACRNARKTLESCCGYRPI